MDKAITAFITPGPSRPANAIANKMPGKAINKSTTITKVLSQNPPNHAPIIPIKVPMINDIETTTIATLNEVRAPMISLALIERPKSS